MGTECTVRSFFSDEETSLHSGKLTDSAGRMLARQRFTECVERKITIIDRPNPGVESLACAVLNLFAYRCVPVILFISLYQNSVRIGLTQLASEPCGEANSGREIVLTI